MVAILTEFRNERGLSDPAPPSDVYDIHSVAQFLEQLEFIRSSDQFRGHHNSNSRITI